MSKLQNIREHLAKHPKNVLEVQEGVVFRNSYNWEGDQSWEKAGEDVVLVYGSVEIDLDKDRDEPHFFGSIKMSEVHRAKDLEQALRFLQKFLGQEAKPETAKLNPDTGEITPSETETEQNVSDLPF